MNNDIYAKLRPWTHVESCKCKSISKLLLVDILTDNPIHCFECKDEVDPEELGLNLQEVEQIANWLIIENALHMLWLDSGEYEAFAVKERSDKDSEVNRRGMEVQKTLSKHRPTYYWWFHDYDTLGDPTHCPKCGDPLTAEPLHTSSKCERCLIII